MSVDSQLSNTSTDNQDDKAIIDAGYRPKLLRSLGLFSSFAVSFSFISITTGIFANYGYALTKAGPFGIWTWLIVGLGQMLVALVYAELAGRIPLAGSTYNWNTKLIGPSIGWFTGWLYTVSISIGTAAVVTTAIPIMGTLLGVTFDITQTRLIAVAMIAVTAIINIYGVRLTTKINTVAVYSEIISIVVLGVLIVAIASYHGELHPSLLTTLPDNPKPYLPGFLMAFLMGSWNIVGFETSADMSEETHNARLIAPKGIISSALAASLLGLAFLIALTISIPNVESIISADNPLIAIAKYHLGDMVTNIFLVFVVVAISSCSLICVTSNSRIIYAMARDGRYIAPKLFQKVSSHHVPIAATIFVAIIASGFAVFSDSLTTLFAATAILPALVYLITVVSFAIGSKKLPATTTFSLGRWHKPVVIMAIIWLIAELGILTIPDEFHSAAYASIGVIVVGLVIYFIVGRNKKS